MKKINFINGLLQGSEDKKPTQKKSSDFGPLLISSAVGLAELIAAIILLF